MPILSEDRRVQNTKAAYWNKYVCLRRDTFTVNDNALKLLESISVWEINAI